MVQKYARLHSLQPAESELLILYNSHIVAPVDHRLFGGIVDEDERSGGTGWSYLFPIFFQAGKA